MIRFSLLLVLFVLASVNSIDNVAIASEKVDEEYRHHRLLLCYILN